MKLNLNSPNLIIMYFPNYAGGKFILNCLALSKHTVPQDKKIAEYLMSNPTDYEYRFNKVLKTLPSTREEMVHWGKYEFSHSNFFGPTEIPEGWYRSAKANEDLFNDLTIKLTNSKFKFFMTIHGGSANWVKNITTVWPNSSIINLINYRKFWKIASKLKNPSAETTVLTDLAGNDCEDKYNLLSGPGWPSWKLFERFNYNVDLCNVAPDISIEMKTFYKWYEIKNPVFNFDIDNTIFDQRKFLDQIKELYEFFNFGDFNPELIGKFWKQYIFLHVDNAIEIA